MGAGGLSGFMGTSVAVGGPPIALVLDGSSGPEFRATLNAFFFIGTTISLAVLAMAGEFGATDLLLALYLLPSMLTGVALSNRVRHLLNQVWLAPMVYTLSSSVAVVLVIRSLT